MTKTELLKITANKTPPAKPSYIVGEKNNWEKFENHLKIFDDIQQTYSGTIQGVTGNGKTHFIRYAKSQLNSKYNVFIIEEMLSQTNFLESLRDIYKRLINNDGDNNYHIESLANKLSNIEKKIKDVKLKINKTAQTEGQLSLRIFDPLYNELSELETINKFPSRILNLLRKYKDNEEFKEILIKFFSGENIQSTKGKKILKELNLESNLIEKESDFVDYFIDYIELVYALTNKPCLIFMDEADRSISSESKIILPRVGFQVLDSLREVFNKLRTPTFFTIGTTTQAWKLIENSISAFARRFDSFHIILKEGKSIDDIEKFIQYRATTAKVNYGDLIANKIINRDILFRISLNANTWRDVLNALKNYAEDKEISTLKIDNKTSHQAISNEEIELNILATLYQYRALTAIEIIENSNLLKKIYPNKNIPTSIFNSLTKKAYLERYKRNKSQPYIYRITMEGNDYVSNSKHA